jgi:hypothetical protein
MKQLIKQVIETLTITADYITTHTAEGKIESFSVNRNIPNILEINCGRGEIFETLNAISAVNYVGIETDSHLYNLNAVKFGYMKNHCLIGVPASDRATWRRINQIGKFDLIVIRGTMLRYDFLKTIDYARQATETNGRLMIVRPFYNYRWIMKYLENSGLTCKVKVIFPHAYIIVSPC